MDIEILSDEENHNMEMDFDMDNEESNHGVFPEDEAIEVPADDPTERKVIKPKKVVRNPQPKLDALRLMGPRGIGILSNTFKDYKFKGKGHEKEDLNILMKKLEHWTHRLFPKLTFDDMLKHLEKLGSKKQVQILVKKMRMDILQSDELILDDNPDDVEVVETVDPFDQLAKQDGGFTFSTMPASQPPSQPREISTEDRERMERNKQLALEKRRSKLADRGIDSASFSQPIYSQTDSVTNSTAMDPEDDMDEDMLKAFDDQDALQKSVSLPNDGGSIKKTDISKDKSAPIDSRSPFKDSSDCELSPKQLSQKEINQSLVKDKSIELCTEDDVLDSL